MKIGSKILLSVLFFIILSSVRCGSKTPTSPDTDQVTNPAIWTNISSISFTGTESGPNPDSQTIQVKNSGGGTLNYTISDDAGWLSCTPSEGISTGNVIEHAVSADIWGLAEGDYSGTIRVESANASNSPKTISVSLTISSPLTDNEIAISSDLSSGSTGTLVTFYVSINGNINEIKAVGLELTFDTTLFEYQSTSKGEKTEDWEYVDGFEVSSGIIRIGGFAGAADSVPVGSVGSIVKVTLEVTCTGCNDGLQSQVCIQNWIDDLAGMVSSPACITFTFVN